MDPGRSQQSFRFGASRQRIVILAVILPAPEVQCRTARHFIQFLGIDLYSYYDTSPIVMLS